jgi:hypothetical protein
MGRASERRCSARRKKQSEQTTSTSKQPQVSIAKQARSKGRFLFRLAGSLRQEEQQQQSNQDWLEASPSHLLPLFFFHLLHP